MDTSNKPLAAASFVMLAAVWILLMSREHAEHPQLHALGIHAWSVTCEGDGRTYRMFSENTRGYGAARHRREVLERSLSVLDEAGEALYYTEQFDPDRFETDAVWAFAVSADPRLWGTGRSGEVLYGDEAVFEIDAGFDALTIRTDERGRLDLPCRQG